MSKLLLALALLCGMTCLLEIVPALFMRERKKWIKAGLICNVITNPILNTLLLLHSALYQLPLSISIFLGKLPFSYPYAILRYATLLVLELLVIVFEAWVYHKMVGASWKKCLLFALAANALSFTVGLLLEPVFTTPLDWQLYKWLF